MNAKQMQELKNKMISESGLYRTIENNTHQDKSEKEMSEAQPLTKDLVSNDSQGYNNTATQQNTRESIDKLKPHFHL